MDMGVTVGVMMGISVDMRMRILRWTGGRGG
jgi:hypothetical protein